MSILAEAKKIIEEDLHGLVNEITHQLGRISEHRRDKERGLVLRDETQALLAEHELQVLEELYEKRDQAVFGKLALQKEMREIADWRIEGEKIIIEELGGKEWDAQILSKKYRGETPDDQKEKVVPADKAEAA